MLNRNKILKQLNIGRYEGGAIAIIVVATLLRLLIIGHNWPVTDSDESTMGLMTLHILHRGEHPTFFYGQNYMGSLEAFLGAGLFHLFGPSIFMLRLGLVILFALFLISIYLLASLLYSKKLALAVLILLSLGSEGMLRQELLAIGGYPDTLLFGTLVLLIASWLALSSNRDISQRDRRWRYVVFGGWGLAAGLGLWSDLLIAPIVLAAGLLLLLGCCRECLTWSLPCLLLGLAVGALPLLIYNVTAQPGQDSISVLLRIHDIDKSMHLPVMNQAKGAFLISLPIITGVYPSCPVITGQEIGFAGPDPFLCFVEYAGWGIGFTGLWMIATILTMAALWKLRPRAAARQGSYEKRQMAILQFARLMLLASAGLTMFFYAVSPNAASYPQTNDRYLIGLLIVIPAVISPLWGSKLTTVIATRIIAAAKGMLLILMMLVLLAGTNHVFQELPITQVEVRQQEALIHDLLRIDATRIYSDYWTCDRITFQSNEQIICAAIDAQGQFVDNRYMPYIASVQADPHAAYVLPADSLQAADFAGKAAFKDGSKYQQFTFDGYEIYLPRASSPASKVVTHYAINNGLHFQ